MPGTSKNAVRDKFKVGDKVIKTYGRFYSNAYFQRKTSLTNGRTKTYGTVIRVIPEKLKSGLQYYYDIEWNHRKGIHKHSGAVLRRYAPSTSPPSPQ